MKLISVHDRKSLPPIAKDLRGGADDRGQPPAALGVSEITASTGAKYLATVEIDAGGGVRLREIADLSIARRPKLRAQASGLTLAERLPFGATVEPVVSEAEFRSNGEYWSIGFHDQQAYLKDRKGLRYVADLLRHPGERICALDLMSFDQERPEALGSRKHEPVAQAPLQWRPVSEYLQKLGDAGAILGHQGKLAWALRLAELHQAREVPEPNEDGLRTHRVEDKLEVLRRELNRVFGRASGEGSVAVLLGRARLNVTRSIRLAIKRVGEFSPELGRHLDGRISTGWHCCYTPDPRQPLNWRF